MKKILIFSIVIYVLTACDGPGVQSEQAYKWKTARKKDNLLATSLTYEYIALDNNPEHGFSGAVHKIVCYKGNYFILDGPRSMKRLFIFDQHGKIVTMIDKRGRGPGEYLSMGDFSVRNDTIYVLDNLKDQIVEYDLAGNHIRSRHLDIYIPTAISATDYGFVIYRKRLEGDDVEEKFALFYLDENLRVFEKHLAYSSDAPSISFDSPFVETENFVVFSQMLWNSVQIFDRKSPGMSEYSVDFGNRDISNTIGKPDEVFEHPERNEFFISVPVFIRSNLIGKISEKGEILNYSLNVDSGTIFKNDGCDLPLYPAYFSQCDEDAIISWLDIAQYEKMARKPVIPEKFLTHMKNDGVILMIVNCKNNSGNETL